MTAESQPSRHWRMRKLRMGFIGFSRENPETGNKEVSINGSNWYALNNGHSQLENPFDLPKMNSLEISIDGSGNGKNSEHVEKETNQTSVIVYVASD